MSSSRDEIIEAALKLADADRLLIASRLLDTLPGELPGLSEDDAEFFDELERRANDSGPTVPISDIWNQD